MRATSGKASGTNITPESIPENQRIPKREAVIVQDPSSSSKARVSKYPSLDLQDQRHMFALAMSVGLDKDGFKMITRCLPRILHFSGGNLGGAPRAMI